MNERTKRCTRCQTVKPWSDFYARKRNPDGSVQNVKSYCRDCERSQSAAWEEARRERCRIDAEYAARRREQLRANSERIRKRNPRYARATPERAGVTRARDRDYRRRRFDIPPERWRVGVASGTHGGPTTNAKPFLDWLQSEWDNPNQAATALGINPRRIQDVWYGRQERLELDTIDRALTNYGRPDLLDVLVPLEQVAA